MYKERFGFAVQHFAVSHLLLVVLFWLIRLYEFFCIAALHLYARNEIPIVVGLSFDAWFCFVLALIVFPVYILLYLFLGPITRFFLGFLFILYVLIYLGLISYFVIKQAPLNADFWSYAHSDILFTIIDAATKLSIIAFVPMIVIVGLLLFYYPKAQEVILPRWVLIVFYGIAFPLGIFYFMKTPQRSWFADEGRYTLSVNKMAYFGETTGTWYLEKNGYKDIVSVFSEPEEFIFSSTELHIIQQLGLDTLNPEQLFALAQLKASENDYVKARLICRKALKNSHDYGDARLLLGRTYYWEGNYEQAKKFFEEQKKRTPDNKEVWTVLIENELKAANYQQALELADEAFMRFRDRDFLSLRKKALDGKGSSKIKE